MPEQNKVRPPPGEGAYLKSVENAKRARTRLKLVFLEKRMEKGSVLSVIILFLFFFPTPDGPAGHF
jgi:hypothetical protein